MDGEVDDIELQIVDNGRIDDSEVVEVVTDGNVVVIDIVPGGCNCLFV